MNQSKFLIVVFSVIFLCFCLIFPISFSHAQQIPSTGTSVSLTASNENPLPGQNVTITAVSYSFDINSATLVWSINGKEVQKGIGLTTLNTSAPSLGKKTNVSVTAITSGGSRYSNNLVLGSGSIDLIIESDGYTPPFFKGKIPFVFQNTITVIAVPHIANTAGQEYSPENLIYQWKKDNGTILQDQSGFGKQSITLKGELIPRPYYLIVTVGSRDGSAQAQSMIAINASSPSITFYKDDPIYGPLFNRSIQNTTKINTKQKETHVFASLFGFNFSEKIANDLTLNWMINGIKHNELASSKSIVLRAPDDSSGISNIELSVRGVGNILQSAKNGFNISFSASDSKSSTAITL